MRKRTLSVTDEAQSDLDGIQAYLVANTSIANAVQVMTWIEETVESLRESAERHPEIIREGLAFGMRGARVFTRHPLTGKRAKPTRWTIFFQIQEDMVGVLGVRHASQKPIWEG